MTVSLPQLAQVRSAFAAPQEFWSSPLYRQLSAVVTEEPFLLQLAAHTRAGQVPTFAFFGAVHSLLLAGVEHPLADYYPSLRGDQALEPGSAGPELIAFAREHADQIREVLRTRLVQTNHVQRAVGLRLGLAAITKSIAGAPIHLLEVGCSTGLLLRHEHYGYHLGERAFGDAHSPVQLCTEWRSAAPIPDLDDITPIASTTGIDLNPLDPSDEADRRWLEALVWPEDRAKADLLDAALGLAVETPVTTLAGDAIDLCSVWAAGTPVGQPRVVFHCATRMHIPADRLALFDEAIASTGMDGPLYRIAVEGDGIVITEPGGQPTKRYDVEGHLAWAKPV